MYKLLVQVLDLDSHNRNPVIHEVHSLHFASIQEAMESYDGKIDFEAYLEIEQKLMKDIEAVKNGEYIRD